MSETLTFGRWLRQRREALGLTQHALAQQISYALVTLRKIEADERKPSLELARRLAEALAIPVAEQDRFTQFARGMRNSYPLASLQAHLTPVTPPPPPHTLPPTPNPLIGREADVAVICDLIQRDDIRLVSLVGAAGAGKTRLAMQVAATLWETRSTDGGYLFPHGVFFVPLAPLTDPGLVISTIAHSLGVRETGQRSLEEDVRHTLRGKRLLLVLDNFEHLVKAAPTVVALLDQAVGLKILVTSRTRLRIAREYLIRVLPLALPDITADSDDLSIGRLTSDAATAQDPPIPDPTYTARIKQAAAVQLFTARASAVRSDFAVTDANARAVTEVCRLLDGLPLALELAAARTRTFSVDEIQARLTETAGRLRWLTRGREDAPARQQTLRATLAWSFGLLSRREQTVFRRLGVFVGGFTLEAARAVVGDDLNQAELHQAVQTLVDTSLLQVQTFGDVIRLTMLETIREYALERLEESQEAPDTRRRHSDYYLGYVEALGPALADQTPDVLDGIAPEQSNYRTVLTWLLSERAMEKTLRLVRWYWFYWYYRGLLSEGRAWLDRVLETPGLGDSHNEPLSEALHAAGTLAIAQGDYPAAARVYEWRLDLCRHAGDLLGVARSLQNLGIIAHDQSRFEDAETLLEECAHLYEQLGDHRRHAYVRVQLAHAAYELHNLPRAATLLDQSLTTYQKLDDRWGSAMALSLLGLVRMDQGQLLEAKTLLNQALVIWVDRAETWRIAWCVLFIGFWACRTGQFERAAYLLAGCTRLWGDMSTTLAPAVRDQYFATLNQVRQTLGDHTFEVVWADASALATETIVELALS